MDSTKTTNTIDTISITGAQGSNTSIGPTGSSDPWTISAGPYISSIDTNNVMWASTPNTVWTTNTSDWSIGTGTHPSGTMELKGDNADIIVNGRSLMDAIDALEQRLNILVPNPELETEWDELRELGERYRELEKKCQEKGDMWAKLKAMPAPEVK
jgi:hypothetical protein